MRGLGKGQTIQLVIIPEITKLITRSLNVSDPQQQQPVNSTPTPSLASITAWLHINSMRSETMQFNLLCEQNCKNVWRKSSFHQVVEEAGRALAPNLANSNSVDNKSLNAGNDLVIRAVSAFKEDLSNRVLDLARMGQPLASKIEVCVCV